MRTITKHQVAAVLAATHNPDGTPKAAAPAGGGAPSPAPPPDAPNDSWTKGDIIDWLDANGIECRASMTKAELLALVP